MCYCCCRYSLRENSEVLGMEWDEDEAVEV